VAALKQARAWPAYRRAMTPFNRVQRALIAHCLLLNWSIARWTARQRESGLLADPKMLSTMCGSTGTAPSRVMPKPWIWLIMRVWR
jgi:hypothetical protein